jgi:hypothetical protein
MNLKCIFYRSNQSWGVSLTNYHGYFESHMLRGFNEGYK